LPGVQVIYIVIARVVARIDAGIDVSVWMTRVRRQRWAGDGRKHQ